MMAYEILQKLKLSPYKEWIEIYKALKKDNLQLDDNYSYSKDLLLEYIEFKARIIPELKEILDIKEKSHIESECRWREHLLCVAQDIEPSAKLNFFKKLKISLIRGGVKK